jgi:hypothetical protein
MNLDEAKSHVRYLNSRAKLKLDELRRQRLREMQELFELEAAAVFPDVFKREFEERFILGRIPNEERRNVISHWRAAQRLLLKLKLDPSDWFEESTKFYDYFYDKNHSLSYLRKILRLANLWGFYISKKRAKPFLPVLSPAGHEKRRLVTSYYAKREKPPQESDPITPEQLSRIRGSIYIPLYNWLYLSVWLGLRPLEIDNLKKDGFYYIDIDDTGTKIMWIYQTKLVSLPPSKRWKPIPLIFKEQQEIVTILSKGEFHRPLTKTVKHHFGEGTTLYGGRKGFTDLMLSRGQSLENIAQWMGHSSIERTWKNYKSKTIFHYHRPPKTSLHPQK